MSPITISITVTKSIDTVWLAWNAPTHTMNWAFASDAWECPHAENVLAPSGRFLIRMSAKDGSAGFDFTGTYDEVITNEKVSYTIDGGRKVQIIFTTNADGTVTITETFDPENENSMEMQRDGWQSILNNFKKYAESLELN